MTPKNTSFKSLIKIISAFLIAVFIIGYTLFEFRGVLQGPIIEVEEPKNWQSFNRSLITIKGKTKNISSLSLNEWPITVDASGDFGEKLLLAPGYNIIKLESKDRFGRDNEVFLEIIYNVGSAVETG